MSRSCYTCKNMSLCFILKGVRDALKEAPINVDGDGSPGYMVDIIKAVGNACLRYDR